MAKFSQGILGGFSGKLGTVVGSVWNGKQIMRARAASHKDANTEAQQMQRSKWSLAIEFLKPLTAYLRTACAPYAQSVSLTTFNVAMSYLLKNAIDGEYPDYVVVPEMVRVSFGSLANVLNPTVSLADSVATFTWADNTGDGDAAETDLVLPVVYNVEAGAAVCDVSSFVRSAAQAQLDIPDAWSGSELHCYVATISADGGTASNSLYVGSVTA